jgi:hypothetical protein
MAKTDLTAQRLRELLHYDPETGVFTRIAKSHRTANRMPLGPIPGSPSDNLYMRIGVDGFRHFAHRLAWLYMTGEWPSADVDHINRDRQDNRWANLRSATRSENMQNTVIGRQNKSGYKGVSWLKHHQQWHAHFKVNKKNVHVGYFATAEEAAAAYARAVVLHQSHTSLAQQTQQAAG